MNISSQNKRETIQFELSAISKLNARDHTSFDDFLSHLNDPPRNDFANQKSTRIAREYDIKFHIRKFFLVVY